jgi:Domain of unknown function (DUF5664)
MRTFDDFKVGDTVVCVDSHEHTGLVAGDLYIIEEMSSGTPVIRVRHVGHASQPLIWASPIRFRYDAPVILGDVVKLPPAVVPPPPGGLDPAASIKESNPKDSIGIRKAPLSCVPATVLLELGVAMQEGAHKYRRHNYRAIGVRASVYYDATMRHLFSWWEGEDTDPDSGLSHVTKAIASLTVLRDAMIQGKFHDDRPPASVQFVPDLNARTAALADKFEGKSLPPYTQLGDT